MTKTQGIPGYMTAQEAARRWGYNYDYLLRMLSQEGSDRVPGATKVGGIWLIPETTKARHVRRTVRRQPTEQN